MSGSDHAIPYTKLVLTATAMVAVWIYARFGALSSVALAAPSCDFSVPCPFVAQPGDGATHINIRTGPGVDFPVSRQLDAGAPVTGIAHRLNEKGEWWVELPNKQGFTKEALLAPGGR